MNDELRDEYEFDYQKARPSRFAEQFPAGGRVVYLEPDVATAFSDSESVNRVLKALLATMPSLSSTNGER